MSNKNPLDTSRLKGPLVLLRKINMAPLDVRAHKNAMSILDHIRQGQPEQGVKEDQLVWFDEGYVVNDQPRSQMVTEEIMENTLGFAIARTDTAEILREFRADQYAVAVKAIEGAEIRLAVDVIVDEAADEAEEADADTEEEIPAVEA